MIEPVYLELRDFFDRLPGGYPTTESGVELRILEKLFTPEEAELVMCLSTKLETAKSVAARRGMDGSETARRLESLAGRGLLFRVRREGQARYAAFQYIFGLYDFQVNTIDLELAGLMEEYFPHLGVIKKQFRVVPVGAALDSGPAVASYDRIRELVAGQEVISVSPCICRKEQGLLGQRCTHPSETCLGFGIAAEYRIENEIGRRISAEQALETLDLAEESGLVLCPTNAREIAFICCCCACCCGMLRVLKLADRPAEQIRSAHRARIEPSQCNGCGICLERCPMQAIAVGESGAGIHPGRCIGCGLCVAGCPEEAVALEPRPTVEPPAPDVVALLAQIGAERGLL